MKKILTILGIITLIETSTTNLVACNTLQKYTPEELVKIKEKKYKNKRWYFRMNIITRKTI